MAARDLMSRLQLRPFRINRTCAEIVLAAASWEGASFMGCRVGENGQSKGFGCGTLQAHVSSCRMGTSAATKWNNEGAPLWRPWTNARPLDEVLGEAPTGGGAYVVSLHYRGRLAVLARLLEKDRFGTLDIGQSGSLRKRLKILHTCATLRGETGHSAGWRYAYLGLDKALGGRLFISWCASLKWKALEARVMTAYVAAFGELPPLNYSFNWSCCGDGSREARLVRVGM